MEEIGKAVPNGVKEATSVGYKMARTLAPEYTGELKNNIFALEFENEGWIISNQPMSDKDPINVWFDEGTLENFDWFRAGHPPRKPQSVGYMKQTAQYLSRYFPDLIIQKVNEITKR